MNRKEYKDLMRWGTQLIKSGTELERKTFIEHLNNIGAKELANRFGPWFEAMKELEIKVQQEPLLLTLLESLIWAAVKMVDKLGEVTISVVEEIVQTIAPPDQQLLFAETWIGHKLLQREDADDKREEFVKTLKTFCRDESSEMWADLFKAEQESRERAKQKYKESLQAIAQIAMDSGSELLKSEVAEILDRHHLTQAAASLRREYKHQNDMSASL